MDLGQHFILYRGAIKEDILDGLVEFTKTLPTKDPQKFPTAYDLMNYSVSEIRRHIKFSDIFNYKKVLQVHQRAMITALERYVHKFFDEYIEMYGLSNGLIKDFITEKGWSWFKFSSEPYIHNDKFLVVPRYYDATMQLSYTSGGSALTILDTDEMVLCTRTRTNPATVKEEGQKIVSFQDNAPQLVPVASLNADWSIQDWTAPLFPEGQA